MMKSENLALSVEDTPSQVTSCGMVHKLNMMISEDLVLLVEDTPSPATSSGMDPNFYKETPLSIEETHQNLKSKVCQENNSGSTGAFMFGNPTIHTIQETNEDVTLCGDCDTQDHEPDHRSSMNNRQDNMDLYTSPQSNSSEIFEDNSEETDIKSEKSKIVDANCPNDHSSMGIQQDSNVSNVIRSDDHSSKLEDGTRAQLVDDNLALRVDGATELFESEQNGKEPCKPNYYILAHHEVNNIFSTTDDCDRNASTLKPDDYIYTEPCTNTAPNKKQDGGNMFDDETIDSEDKRSPDHGEDINELLYPTTSIKEADAQEKISKVFDDSSPIDSSSTDLHLQDSNVTKLISPDNNSAMDLKSEESSAVGNETSNFVSEGQRLNLESVDNDDVGYKSILDIRHEVTTSLSAANHTDKNVSSINSDESTDIKASNISTCSQLQGGGDVDTKEPENNVSIDNGRRNNESSCLESNNAKDDTMSTNEENKISPKVHRSNNKSCIPFISSPEVSITLCLAAEILKSQKNCKKAFGSKQNNNNVNCKPNDDKQANNRVTGVSKTEANASIDVGCNKTTNISKTNNGTSLESNPGRRRGNKNVKSNNSPKNDNPEDKTFLGNGGESNVRSFLEPKSRHRSQSIENRPNVFDTTGSTYSQQHGDVLTKERSPDKKSWTMNIGLCKRGWLISFIALCFMVNPVKASPMPQQRQQILFCGNNSLMNQTLTIKNLYDRHSAVCTFSYTNLPYIRNCSESGHYVVATNKICVQMWINATLSAGDWILEYGHDRNGEDLPATRGELLSEELFTKKISKLMNETKHQSENTDKSETKDKSEYTDKGENTDKNNTMLIAGLIGGVAFVAFVISIALVWKFCPKFRSCVDFRRRPATSQNTDPNERPSTSDPLVNRQLNGVNHNDDVETQRLSPESTEERNPNTSETSL